MRADVNDTFLEYDTFGNPDQAPLLLISGLNTPMTRWTQQFCERLVDSGFYVVRYNNRDTGLSEHFDRHKPVGLLWLLVARMLGFKLNLPYTMNDMVKDGVALLDALKIDKAHIVGRSMGGVIAQLIASTYPERVISLTAIMSTTGNRKLPKPSSRVMRLILKKAPHPKTDIEGYLQHRIKYTRAIGSTQYPTRDEDVRKRIIDDLSRGGFNPGGGKRQLAALVQAGDIRTATRKITCPTLVLHGDCDPLVPLVCGLDIHKNIKHSKLCVIEHMGHSLHDHFFDTIIREIRWLKESTDKPHDQSDVLALQNA